jgi:hypothetical protein
MRVIYTSKGVMKMLGCALSIEKYSNLIRLSIPQTHLYHEKFSWAEFSAKWNKTLKWSKYWLILARYSSTACDRICGSFTECYGWAKRVFARWWNTEMSKHTHHAFMCTQTRARTRTRTHTHTHIHMRTYIHTWVMTELWWQCCQLKKLNFQYVLKK